MVEYSKKTKSTVTGVKRCYYYKKYKSGETVRVKAEEYMKHVSCSKRGGELKDCERYNIGDLSKNTENRLQYNKCIDRESS